jgi:hypothetical protein
MKLFKSLWRKRRWTQPRFALGDCFVSNVACYWLREIEIGRALTRHQFGDWGEVPQTVASSNEDSLLSGDGKVVSSYISRAGHAFEIVTQLSLLETTLELTEDPMGSAFEDGLFDEELEELCH